MKQKGFPEIVRADRTSDIIGRDPAHTHNYWQLQYIAKGELRFFVEDRIYHLKEGDALLIAPGLLHRFNNNCIKLVSYVIKYTWDEQMSAMGPVAEMISLHEDRSRFEETCSSLVYEERMQQAHYRMITGMKVQELLYLLLRSNQNRISERIQYSLPVARVLRYIREKYDTALTVDELISRSGVSRAKLYNDFNREVGQSPIELAIDLRMAKARQLMQEGDMLLKQVAYQVGYENVPYFSRLFKKHTGMNPSAYAASIERI